MNSKNIEKLHFQPTFVLHITPFILQLNLKLSVETNLTKLIIL